MGIVSAAAFVLLGGVFIWSGVEHFMKFKLLARNLADRLVAPSLVLATVSALEIVAGLCLILGFERPYAAAFLIVFTILASLLLLDFWRYAGPQRDTLRAAFLINFAVVGGLLLAIKG